MNPAHFFAGAEVILCTLAAIFYAAQRQWNTAIYWTGAVIITGAVLWRSLHGQA